MAVLQPSSDRRSSSSAGKSLNFPSLAFSDSNKALTIKSLCLYEKWHHAFDAYRAGSGDLGLAYSLFEELNNLNEPDAHFYLGECCYYGSKRFGGFPRDATRALGHYQEGVKAGSALAHLGLADFAYFGHPSDSVDKIQGYRDTLEAEQYYSMVLEEIEAEMFGLILVKECTESDPQSLTALEVSQQCSCAGMMQQLRTRHELRALAGLADCKYDSGDHDGAKRYYRRALELGPATLPASPGYLRASARMARFYMYGSAGTRVDHDQAIRHLSDARMTRREVLYRSELLRATGAHEMADRNTAEYLHMTAEDH